MKCIVSIPGFGQYAFTVHTVVNDGKSVPNVPVEYHHDVGKPVNPGDSRRK